MHLKRHQFSPHRAHLSLETLSSVLHDVKVLQVQVDVVAFPTLSCRHVPHHNEGLLLQDRSCSCSHRQRESGTMGGGTGQRSAWWEGGEKGEEEKSGHREVRQHHGCCSAADESVLTGERNRPMWLMRMWFCSGTNLININTEMMEHIKGLQLLVCPERKFSHHFNKTFKIQTSSDNIDNWKQRKRRIH